MTEQSTQHPDQGAPVPPDFRALCAELVDELEDWIVYGHPNADVLFDRTRAALALPVPPGPTDEELLDVADLRDACNAQAVAALAALETLADAVDQFGPAGGADGRALAAEVEKARKFLDCAAALHPAHVLPIPGDNQQ